MKITERNVMLGGLAGLAALVILQSPAHTAVTTLADLGPADGLILTGKDSNLTLKNGGGRIQWGDQATSKAWSVGAVNTDKIMRALMASKTYKDQQKSLEEELKSKDEEFTKRQADFMEKYKDERPGSANYEEASKLWQAFQREVQEWREGFTSRMAKLEVDQIEQAYRELATAVDVVAERMKIDLVFRFVPTAAKFTFGPEAGESKDQKPDAFSASHVISAMDQVRARTFVRHPEALDITAEVTKELNLKDE